MSTFYASYPVEGGSGGGVPIYATFSALPAGTAAGDLAVAADSGILYEWNGTIWQPIASPGSVLSVGTIDSNGASSNGASITSNTLIMQSASATNPGLVNNITQTLSGNKTFTGSITASNLSGTNTGNVTLGTASGLSLAGQVLSLALSSGSTVGALSSADWNTFNSKQSAGNYITALTGDVSASGPGSAAVTLATVNSNVGSFGLSNITVNAKGLVTAASSTSVGAAGSVQFSNGTTLAQDNSNFFWDDAANKLGIGTNAPTSTLSIVGDTIGSVSATDSFAVAANFSATSHTTIDGSNTTIGIQGTATGTVSSGATNDKEVGGLVFTTIRGDSTDNGNLNAIAGVSSLMFHNSGLSGITDKADGFYSALFLQQGVITTSYDFHSQTIPAGSGTVTNPYGIYIEPYPYSDKQNWISGKAQIGGSSFTTLTYELEVPGTIKASTTVIAPTIEDTTTQVSVHVDNRQLLFPGAVTSIDWLNMALYRTTTVASIDYGNGFLINNAGAITLDYQGMVLQDELGVQQLFWASPGIQLPQLTASTVPYLDASKILTSSAVTPTELGYVSGVTSSIQTQINSKQKSLRTINAQTGTTYTFVITDGSGNSNNPLVTASNAAAQTYTVPTFASVAFPVGTQIDVMQLGAGKVTFAGAGGVTINSQSGNLAIGAQYVGVSLINIATDSWVLIGSLQA